ncbi:MAG: AEC family transporter [Oscillospiraceae bacterium]|nr:AEC family transporter [Oscillospiraceae bacterium]MBQ6123708.1 AEC family transporter [Clostridia bacterium]
MSAALHQITVIFIGILAGFVCRKGKVLSEEGTATVSNIVVKIILPFYLFSAILNSGSAVDSKGVLLTLGLSFGMFLLSGLVALLVVPLLRPPAGDRGVYLFETMCGNVTYIGIPVCAAVLGGNAAFYGSLLNIPYNLLCFSLGIWLLAGKLPLKKILNPAFLSGVAAALLYLLRVPVPSVILDGCAFIGQATSPCAMLVIGSVLGSVPFKEIFTEWRAIPYVLLRLVGLGALMALLLSFLDVDPVLKGVLILMASMPAATNSTMLCTIYGGNRALSAKLIFLSTALSIVTIPLWALVYFG